MKVISKTKAILLHDREGVLEEFVQIKIQQTLRDSENKTITFKTIDSLVLNRGLENESYQVHKDRRGSEQVLTYTKTFAEYKAQRKAILLANPSTLTGDDLDDYVLVMSLLDDLAKKPIYGVEFEIKP